MRRGSHLSRAHAAYVLRTSLEAFSHELHDFLEIAYATLATAAALLTICQIINTLLATSERGAASRVVPYRRIAEVFGNVREMRPNITTW